jgi:Rrf2 family protein
VNLITKHTDYAVQAISIIAETEGRVSVSELVKKLKLPYPFLRKILQALSSKGILLSYKGKDGGFELRRPVEKIFLGELIRIFQKEIRLNECMFKKKICPSIEHCLLRKNILNIEKYVVSQLDSINIGSLINYKGGK